MYKALSVVECGTIISSFRLCISPAETNPILRDEKKIRCKIWFYPFCLAMPHFLSTLVKINPLPISFLLLHLCLVAFPFCLPICLSVSLSPLTQLAAYSRIHMFFLILSNPYQFLFVPLHPHHRYSFTCTFCLITSHIQCTYLHLQNM